MIDVSIYQCVAKVLEKYVLAKHSERTRDCVAKSSKPKNAFVSYCIPLQLICCKSKPHRYLCKNQSTIYDDLKNKQCYERLLF